MEDNIRLPDNQYCDQLICDDDFEEYLGNYHILYLKQIFIDLSHLNLYKIKRLSIMDYPNKSIYINMLNIIDSLNNESYTLHNNYRKHLYEYSKLMNSIHVDTYIGSIINLIEAIYY